MHRLGFIARSGRDAQRHLLRRPGYHLPARETELDGEPWMLESLHAPMRIGERMRAMHNPDAAIFEALAGTSPEIGQLG